MAENSFPCPACGGPIEPNPGEKRTTCGFCGVAVSVPADFVPRVNAADVLARVRNALAGGNKIEAVRLYREGMGVGLKEAKDAVNALEAEYNPRPAPPKIDQEQVADVLRKAQPIAAGALNTYAWWSALRRIVPGCLILLVAVCIISCASFAAFILLLQQQGGYRSPRPNHIPRRPMRKLILLLFVALTCLALPTPTRAGGLPVVFYRGGEGGVLTALRLAGFPFTDDPALAEVFVLNGVIPPDETITRRLREENVGLLLILGPDLGAEQAATLLGVPLELTRAEDAVALTALAVDDPLVTQIVWNSAPQVRERASMVTPVSSVQPLVVAYETGDWVVWQARARVFVVNAYLDGFNPQIQEWAYFNYCSSHATLRAGGGQPLSFADYPYSPVPHDRERNVIVGAVLGLVAITVGIFIAVRRYSLAHPQALDSLVANRDQFEVREGQTAWEEVGFHRPLSGFLVALSLGIVLFIPLIIYQNLVLPTYILPSAQALGVWGRVTQFFNLMWTFFDMGTSIAFIKYMSQYRVHDPRRGILFGQLFVWWQAISGAVQVALVIALTATYAPQSAFAIYTWSVIVHALIQVPGFFQVFRHALTGLQRQDYSRLLDLAWTMFPLAVQPVIVTLMFRWGAANPVFGGPNGGVIGMGIAAYVSEFLVLLLGLFLYRRLGYNAVIIFMAHFDWDTIKAAFRFGVFEMLGSMAWAAGQAAEIAITQTRLVNYAEIWGNWIMAQNFVFAFNIVAILFDGTMAAVSEAVSSGKRLLAQYYSVMMYKWGGTMSAFLGAVLLAVGPKFILGSTGPEFERAAVYILPLALWGAIQFPSWVGDQVHLGSNRPYLKSLLVFSEQVVRVAIAWVLLARLQVIGLIVAYFIGLGSKGLAAYFINNRVCYPQKYYFWQSLAAPVLAAAAHFFILNALNGLLWRNDEITSILIFFIGILPSFPLFMFLYGLFGGWDDDTLAEFGQAVALAGFTRPLVSIFYHATAWGARFSPVHGRFPIRIRPAAMAEARALTDERVKL